MNYCKCGECRCAPQAPPYWRELEIIKELKNRGHEAVLAGGCVRDYLLGRQPKDYDIATSATPAEVSQIFKHVLEDGQEYGVSFVCDYGDKIDVATFREDIGISDGRRPTSVKFTKSMRDDAARRDFTINALYWDPSMGDLSETLDDVFDYHHGLRHLREKEIVAVGNPVERFKEDYLRVLRAIRFSAELGFSIETELASAIFSCRKGLAQISKERIRDEFFKTISHPGGFMNIVSYGLFELILGRDDMLHIDPIHIQGNLDNLQFRSPGSLLAATLSDKEPALVDAVGRDLKLPYAEVEIAKKSIELLPRAAAYSKMQVWEALEFYKDPYSKYAIDLLRSMDPSNKSVKVYKSTPRLFGDKLSEKPVVTGHFILGLGFKEGPLFKEVIRQCRRLQDAGVLETEDEFAGFIRVVYGKSLSPV